MFEYKISARFNSTLSKLKEAERSDVLAYAILLEEIIDERNRALDEIQNEIINFREPMEMLSSDTQLLIRNIHDIIEKLKQEVTV
jgi:hypothetical protein